MRHTMGMGQRRALTLRVERPSVARGGRSDRFARRTMRRVKKGIAEDRKAKKAAEFCRWSFWCGFGR